MARLRLLLVLIFIAWVIPAAGAAPNTQGGGVVDSFVVAPVSDGFNFTAVGWAGAGNPESKPVALTIKLGNELVYEGRFETIARPKVAKITGRPDWANSGWRVTAAIPRTVKDGVYALSVRATISDGAAVNLVPNPKTQEIVLNRTPTGLFKKIAIVFGLISAICLFYVVLLHGEWLVEKVRAKTGKTIAPPAIAAGLICAVFGGLVAVGLTGSSFKLLYDQAPFVEAKSAHIALFLKHIRSDEWMVITPLAIGQTNHQPSFPIVNRNLGEDGQNMLVVGMAGVPVQHVTALAKPATWGFFLFDLKRALAWYWWFPIFGCLLALWGVFGFLIPGQWRLGLFLSLLFCLSPYSVAWSNWPAYTVFFPSLALCAALLILRQKSPWRLVALGLVLGLAIPGFVLVLYPPWQVSVGCLFVAIAIGLVLRDRAALSLDGGKLAAFHLAAGIAALILWSWWIDAKPAIEAMMNTVYPGVRDLTGGGMTVYELLRGFTNIGTLYKIEGGTNNQSEIASFYYLFLPLVVAVAMRIKSERKALYLMLPIMLFAAFALWYMLHGVPHFVARLTFWNRVQPLRADIALGLTYIVLCGLTLAGMKSEVVSGEKKKLFAYLVSLAWAAVAAYAIAAHPKGELAGITPAVAVALLCALFLSGAWLILGETKKFMAISLALYAATTLPFHPFSFAPKKVEPGSDIGKVLARSGDPLKSNKRVLLLDTQIPAMALMSSGIPTVNGVLYYPQTSLWRHLNIEKSKADVINRYQHLLFKVSTLEGPATYTVESPYPDMLQVTIDDGRFDFGTTGAGLVLAQEAFSERLRKNPSIRLVHAHDGWMWYQVTGVTNEKPNGANK